MLIFKLWYLAFFSASSCLYPFFNVIFRRTAGLTAGQLGTIAALRPWVGMPSGGILSGIADKWRLHRVVILLTFVLFSMGRLSVAAATSFSSVLSLMLFSDACGAPVTIIVDAAVMAACPEEGEYARQRLYGAVGWGVFAFVAGSAIAYSGVKAAFVLNAALSLLALVPTAMLPFGSLHAKLVQQHEHVDGEARGGDMPAGDAESRSLESENDMAAHQPCHTAADSRDEVLRAAAHPAKAPPRVHFWQGMGKLMRDPEAVLFFVIAAVFGYAVGGIEGFLFLYLEDLGGSETLMGLTLTVTCVAETAVFYWTGAIMRALGLDACFHLCFLAFLLRLGAYATLAWWPSPSWVLPVELLHGFTFGLTWSAGTAKSALIAQPGLEATTQSIFQGLLYGVGHGLVGLVGGRVYQQRGPGAMYALAFAVVACGWAVTTLARQVVRGSAIAGGGGTQRYQLVAVVELTEAV